MQHTYYYNKQLLEIHTIFLFTYLINSWTADAGLWNEKKLFVGFIDGNAVIKGLWLIKNNILKMLYSSIRLRLTSFI